MGPMARKYHGNADGDEEPLTEACKLLIQAFKYPCFEGLVSLQILLPVLYAFLIPFLSVFVLECVCNNGQRAEDSLMTMRKKLNTVLVGTWVHWYIHWELWAWFWCSLGIYFSLITNCDKLPRRFYEYTIALGGSSIIVSLVSNLLSDYRMALPKGRYKIIFNVLSLFLLSWIPRLIYPCCLSICIDDDAYDIDYNSTHSNQDIEASRYNSPPPSYNDAVEPPPTYAETLDRIRTQLPKFQRSISLQAQRWGRTMSQRGKESSKSFRRSTVPKNQAQSSEEPAA